MKTLECTFKSWDGTELFYRAWLADDFTNQTDGSNSDKESRIDATRTERTASLPRQLCGSPPKLPRKALLLFHRGHEHSGRWQEMVEELGLEDVSVFAWDARGHGRSPGERGSAEDLSVIVRDVDAFVRHISAERDIGVENMIVLAHSVGAVAVAAWVHDYAPAIRALILATPALRVRLYVPFAVPLLRLKEKIFRPGFVKSYVKAKMLTHDPAQAVSYEADPLIFRQIAVNMLLGLNDTSTRLLADAGAILVPTLILSAGSDWVVKNSVQRKFFERLSSPIKEMETYEGFFHAIFHEQQRARVIERVRKFCRERFEATRASDSLLDADQQGYTKAEYEGLCTPGGTRFKLMKTWAKLGAFFSEGLRLGWRSGFDSGLTLDYVYKNQPSGWTWFGRVIDKHYLESIGWRGIRQRKIHLEKLLQEVIRNVHSAGCEVKIVDIAAGPGRYVLETLQSLREVPVSAVLRDYKEENVRAACDLAEELGLNGVTGVRGDAFDRASLAGIRPRPTIGIVSGLYELFPQNRPVLESLRGLADAIQPGGYLIYTNQPWHPQIEFIARVLTNREGKPWIMRRRTQAEMDQLVRAAGFEKVGMEIDRWGIFTVSVARRIGSAKAEPEDRDFQCGRTFETASIETEAVAL